MKINNENLFYEIDEKILDNYYEHNDTKITLRIKGVNEDNEFSIELKVDSPKIQINFDTRVAIEKHKPKTKDEGIHVQADFKKTTFDFFKSGELHVFLDVKNEDELLEACKGFVYCSYEILKRVESILDLNNNEIVEYFFAESIDEYDSNKPSLHKLMYNSLSSNRIDLKGHKSQDYSNLTLIKKLSILFLLFNKMQLLKPIFEEPTFQTYVEIPEIKKLGLKVSEHKRIISRLINQEHKLEKYTSEKYLVEYKKIV